MRVHCVQHHNDIRGPLSTEPSPDMLLPWPRLAYEQLSSRLAGVHRLLMRLHRDYAPASIVITENGAAYATAPDASARVKAWSQGVAEMMLMDMISTP